jgi:hypothetical protein
VKMKFSQIRTCLNYTRREWYLQIGFSYSTTDLFQILLQRIFFGSKLLFNFFALCSILTFLLAYDSYIKSFAVTFPYTHVLNPDLVHPLHYSPSFPYLPRLSFGCTWVGLNSELHACQASALPPESRHQPCFVLGVLFLFCFAVLGLERRACTLSHSTTPLCVCVRYFLDRVSWTICPFWLWTSILLISASWVTRIIGVSHQHLVPFPFLKWLQHVSIFHIYTCTESTSTIFTLLNPLNLPSH